MCENKTDFVNCFFLKNTGDAVRSSAARAVEENALREKLHRIISNNEMTKMKSEHVVSQCRKYIAEVGMSRSLNGFKSLNCS